MKYRYPGIQSFTTEDQSLFFGRDRETKELFRLILLNNLVVLFGKSGIGKTSLLQAGIAPLLSGRLLYPIKIRLNNTHQSISRQIYEQLNEAELLPVDTPDDLSLWEYCQRMLFVSGGEVHTPVLILDQFEELFSLYQNRPEVQQDFIHQFSAVVNKLAPLEYIKPDWGKEEKERFLTPPNINIVISIRSDFLYMLDRLSSQIPFILRCRYELYPLSETNARTAIIQPALLKEVPQNHAYNTAEEKFISPPFKYNPLALEEIIDSLTLLDEKVTWANGKTIRGEVEAFQLQLLCRHIEQKIIAEKCPSNFEIYPDFYNGKAGIEAILRLFYASVLDKFDETSRPKIQKLVEEKLLSDERRIVQEKQFLKRECQINDTDLEILTLERLLKAEPRGGSLYYEISHDTLVAPIVKARDSRLAQEREFQLEQERLEAEQRILEAEEKARIEAEKRAEAEALREEAERLRSQAEALRVEAETSRNKAEQRRTAALWFAFLVLVAALAAILLWRENVKINNKLNSTNRRLELKNDTLTLTLNSLITEKKRRDALEESEAVNIEEKIINELQVARLLKKNGFSYEAQKKIEEINALINRFPNNKRIQDLKKSINF